jgi:hypothetical protein
MKFSMTRQEKGDLLVQVTAWTGLAVVQQKEKIRKYRNMIKSVTLIHIMNGCVQILNC